MPTIRVMNQGDTADALASLKFNVIPRGGAIVNLWASCVTSGDTIGFSVGDRQIFVDTLQPNIESAADVIDTQRDQVLWNEICPSGQMYVPVAVTTALNFMIHLRYVAA